MKEQELVRNMEKTEMNVLLARGICHIITRKVFSDFMNWKAFKVFEV